MGDAELQAAIAARDKQVAALLSNPSAAVKAALADPPYTATSIDTKVRIGCRLVCSSADAGRPADFALHPVPPNHLARHIRLL
jgi:hypothetical protein